MPYKIRPNARKHKFMKHEFNGAFVNDFNVNIMFWAENLLSFSFI